MPSGAIEQHNSVRAFGDMARYLVEVKLHGNGVRDRQRKRSTFAARWADRAEEIGTLVALVGGLARS